MITSEQTTSDAVSTDAVASHSDSQKPVGHDQSFHVTHKQFDDLCRQFYKAWFRYHPDYAVDVGVNDYADQLRSYDHDDIGALIALNQKMLSALDELNPGQLDEVRRLDLRIIKGAITIELHDLEENDWRYRNPVDYVPVNAIYQLMIHPGDNFQLAIKHRLEKIPEYLRGAKVMLSQHPERVVPQWAITARDIASAGVGFIRGLDRHPLMTSRLANPARMQPLLDAAATALNDFASYLENDVLPKADGKFASGKNRFDRLLKEKHFLDVDAESVLAYGERLAAETEEQLLAQSELVCGERDIAKALRIVHAKHQGSEQLLDNYRKKMQRAHSWLRKADIVSIPRKQSLSVQETPEFLRSIIPFAAYEPPLPQDEEQRGLYYVTIAEEGGLLVEHNDYSIDLTSVHEAFPGHHLQFVTANLNNHDNVTRLLNASASMYEGWALYCEQLVCEQGLYAEKEHHFIMLRDRLWRALRVIIDVKIHTGQFSFDEAVDLLVEKLSFDRVQAHAEVSWYSNSATTPLCYAIGREIILKTRDQVDTAYRPKLKHFHDGLLSQGSIALPLIIQTVFGKTVWQNVRDEIFG
jgi:uncharacterized protein (DUF885 family)